jgi:hypothetical protein
MAHSHPDHVGIIAALLLVYGYVAIVSAAEPKGTVGATLGFSTQPMGASDSPYLGPGFGGTSVCSVLFVDADVSPAVTVGGEISVARDITGSQRERVPEGGNTLLSEHHDTVVSGMVKLKTPATSRFQMAAGAGAGLARRQTNRSGTFGPFNPPFVLTPVTETLSDTVLAVTGGLDGVFAINRRVGILALVRVHYLADNDRLPDGVVHRGVSSVILRYGIGARVRF